MLLGDSHVLYYLHLFADKWSALGVFKSVGFRAAFALVTSFLICIAIGPRVISFLRAQKIREDVTKKDSPFLVEKHAGKSGTPTMGGAILMSASLTTILLWCRLDVLFIPLCIFTMLSLGLVGFYDDYVKLTDKRKDGPSKAEKIFYQLIVGGGVGTALYLYGDERMKSLVVLPFPILALARLEFFPPLGRARPPAVRTLHSPTASMASQRSVSSRRRVRPDRYFAGRHTPSTSACRAYLAQELAIVCAAPRARAWASSGSTHPAEILWRHRFGYWAA